MANEIGIKVKKIDTSEIDKVGDAGKQAGKEAGDGLEHGLKQGEQGAGRALKGVRDDLDKTGAAGKKAGSDAGQGLTEGIEGAAKGGALAAGAGIGALLIGGVTQQFEQQKLGGLLAAQTGAVSGAAAQLGDTAGQVFGDSFGESLDDVRVAMKAVFDNKLINKDAAQADIKAVTEQLMTVAQVVEEDAGRVARATQQLVRTGLAGSITDAMNLLTHAQQEGLNASEDLLDTTIEYSTKFRDLGLGGAEAFGLISQAVKAGARDTDTAADALKEFAIRAIDGSATTARGFREIGLDAEVMGNKIAGGGAAARNALAATLDAVKAIEDPVIRDQVAVDLFGTKAEDLGDSLQAMDLDTAKQEFGDFARATAKAANEVAENTPKIEVAWRNLSAKTGEFFDLVSDSNPVKEGVRRLRELNAEIEASQPPSYEERVKAAANAWSEQRHEIKRTTESLDEFISKQQQLVSGVLDLSGAQIGYQKALDDAAAAAKENGKTLDLNTEKGRNNQEALNDLAADTYDLIGAMEEQGSSAQDMAAFMGTARESFITTAVSMGMSRDAAVALADKLRLIPGDYTARVHTPGVSESTNAVRTLHGKLVDLTNRDWIASVAVVGAGNLGGGRYFRAHGGTVGTSTAATGGPRANQVLVGEEGPEIVDLAPGSMVHTAADSNRMRAGWGGGPVNLTATLTLAPGADAAAGAFVGRLIRDGYLQLAVDDTDRVRAG